MATFFKIIDLPEVPDPRHAMEEEVTLNYPGSKITGIMLTGNNKKKVLRRGTLGINHNDIEIFPSGYPAELFVSGVQVSPDDRFYTLDLEVANGKFKYQFVDVENPLETFAAYTPKIILRLEKPE